MTRSLTRCGLRAAWLACMLAFGAAAEDAAAPQELGEIVAEQRALQQAIEAGEVARPPAALAAIRRAQRVVFTVTDGRTALSQLPPDEQMHLHNALQKIETQLSGDRQAALDQDVCRRERATGSSIPETRCGTVREREITREGARGYLEKRQICRPPGCG